MRFKLALTVLLLVVVPTAILSLMATQALRNWGLVLQRRLEASAVNSVKTVTQRVQLRLDDDLERVRATMFECLSAGGQFQDIETCAKRLRESRGSVARVYLFMDPRGFVYPSDQRAASRDGPPGAHDRDLLVATLRRRISSTAAEAPFRFTLNDASYCFARVRGSKVLYAGFRVDPDAFERQIETLITDASGGGVRLVAHGPGLEVAPGGGGGGAGVIIRDPLSGTDGEPGEPSSGGVANSVLAEGRLLAPLDFVQLTAYLDDPERVRQTGMLRARLYGWGIVLLICGIVAGVWLVFRASGEEIRRARSRTDFVVGVSHDLRTPVSSMKVLAESLYLGHVRNPEKQKRFLGTIVRECGRLSQLVERVLFFVRFGQNALIYRRQERDVGETVKSAVEAFLARTQTGMDEGGQNLAGDAREDLVRVRIAEGLPPASIDESAITQVILNLLDNAQKYSAASGKAVDIDVACAVRRLGVFRPKRTWVRVAVRDYGIGIEASQLRRVFRQFYRAPGAGKENVSGVGLGLAVCKHVMDAHDGWIEAGSKSGEGSTFAFYLPALAEM